MLYLPLDRLFRPVEPVSGASVGTTATPAAEALPPTGQSPSSDGSAAATRLRDSVSYTHLDVYKRQVERLRARGDLDLDKPSMRAVGYRQVWLYLTGGLDYALMTERALIATRQLAKRQMTWLRTEQDEEWLESADPDLLAKSLNLSLIHI